MAHVHAEPGGKPTLDPVGLRRGEPREIVGIDAERDRADADEDEQAERAAHPFAGAERPLHRREHAPADEQGERERTRGAQRIGEKQDGGARARPL